jgi:ribosome-associated heat shock protein Hsp15
LGIQGPAGIVIYPATVLIFNACCVTHFNVLNFTELNFTAMAIAKEKLRLDKYLWAIRIFKTRSQASEACEKSKVKLDGSSVKHAKTVNVGDEYEIKTEARKWVIKVSALLDHRVQYSEAINYYIDLTPAEELERVRSESSSFHTGKRLSKIGRPTKKQRRDLGGFMDEE